jgi:hypothetical protein
MHKSANVLLIMNGPRMNDYPQQPYPQQNPNQGRNLGAVGPHEMPAPPQWGQEQGGFQPAAAEQGRPRDAEVTQQIGRVGASNLLNLREFSKADIGKSTGVTGEAVQAGWRINPQGETVPAYRNAFVTRKLQGFGADGRPVIVAAEVSQDQTEVIQGIHNGVRAGTRARVPAPSRPVVQQSPNTSGPKQTFGPTGATPTERRGTVSPEKPPQAEEVRKPAARRARTSRGLRTDDFGRTVGSVESFEGDQDDYYDWRHDDAEDERTTGTRGTAGQAHQELTATTGETEQPEAETVANVNTEAEPAARPRTPDSAKVGGAVAADRAGRIEDAEGEVPQGIAALGDEVVELGAEANVHHADPKPNRNAVHEEVPRIDPNNGPIIFG